MELLVGVTDEVKSSKDIFTVTLPRYNLKWQFNKDQYLKLYPNSLFGTILELDKGTSDIDITESHITPTVMSILYIITMKYDDVASYSDQLDHVISVQASKYLLVDELILFSQIEISKVLKKFSYDEIVRHIRSERMLEFILSTDIERMLEFILQCQWNIYIDYIWDKIDQEEREDILIGAIINNNMSVVQDIIIRRHIDPVTSQCQHKRAPNRISWLPYEVGFGSKKNNLIREVCYFLYNSTMMLDLVNPRLTALYYACKEGHLDIVKFLLQNTNVKDVDNYQFLNACSYSNISLATILVMYHPYTPETYSYAIYRTTEQYQRNSELDLKMNNSWYLLDYWQRKGHVHFFTQLLFEDNLVEDDIRFCDEHNFYESGNINHLRSVYRSDLYKPLMKAICDKIHMDYK